MGNRLCNCGTASVEQEIYTKEAPSILNSSGMETYEFDPNSSSLTGLHDNPTKISMRMFKDQDAIAFYGESETPGDTRAVIINLGGLRSDPDYILSKIRKALELEDMTTEHFFAFCKQNFIDQVESIYLGQVLDGKRHKKGQELWSNGTFYEGDYVRGERNGFGVFKLVDGSKYQGEFADGYMEGYGKLTGIDGYEYRGGWKRNLKDGHGCEHLPDGRKFVGTFKAGEKVGNGRYYWPNGKISGLRDS